MSSAIVAESGSSMTWHQSKDGGRYDMWLSRDIPKQLTDFFVKRGLGLLLSVGIALPSSCAWALHPGGKGILKGFEEALGAIGIKPTGIEHSHKVLQTYGNMSSATIFFVLQRVLASTQKNKVFFAGFGPGLTVEYGCINRVARVGGAAQAAEEEEEEEAPSTPLAVDASAEGAKAKRDPSDSPRRRL